jgi:NitT/TauT family transport system substrate-binding protein
LTHAPALIGVEQGTFRAALPGYDFQTVVVNAGPEAMEALLAGDIDMAYVGPSPALNTYVKSNGRALQIVSGVCCGGASLMAREGEKISTISDLDGKRVAVPELGGTQDVSLRRFLAANRLVPKELGGTVEILPIKNPDILSLFKRGELDAAWVPEPWASRLVVEAHASLVVDERTLWPGDRFTTAVLVASRAFIASNPDAVERVADANAEIIAEMNARPAWAREKANDAIKALTGKALRKKTLDLAWTRLSFSSELDRQNLMAFAGAARQAGYLKATPSALVGLCAEKNLTASTSNGTRG